MKMEQTERSETLAYKIQTPGNYPEKAYKTQLSVWLEVASRRGTSLISHFYQLLQHACNFY
jgi:hypothetical protein